MDPDRLVAIGGIREFSGDLVGRSSATGWRRPRPPRCASSRAWPGAIRMPAPRRAAQRGGPRNPEALWALARIDLRRRPAGRRARQPRSVPLRRGVDDPGVADARAARDALLQRSTEEARARARRQVATAGAGAALLAGLAAWLWAGVTLQSALRRAPTAVPAPRARP